MSELAELNGTAQAEATVAKKRSPVRRAGCGLILAIWFTLLMTPCALFYLAANGEIRIEHADIPEPHAHPRLLVLLINDVENRGLQIMRSFAAIEASEGEICVQTDVKYLLWQTREGNQDVSYCDCYERTTAESPWTLSETRPSVC